MSHKLLKSLLLKLAKIQNRIDSEQKTPSRNWVNLIRLKKIRLKISDRLYQVSKQIRIHSFQNAPNKRNQIIQ